MFRKKAKTFTRAQQLTDIARYPGATHPAETKSSWTLFVATAVGTCNVFIDLPPSFPECAPRFHISPLLSHASADANGVISHSALSQWTPASKMAEVIEAVIHPIINTPPVARTFASQPHYYESPSQVEGCVTLEIAPKSDVPTEVCEGQPQYYAPTQEPIALSAAAAAQMCAQPMYAQPMAEMQPVMQSRVISSARASGSRQFDAREWASREPLRVDLKVSHSGEAPTVKRNKVTTCNCNSFATFGLWISIALMVLPFVVSTPAGSILFAILAGIFYVVYSLEWMGVACVYQLFLGRWVQIEELEQFRSEAPHIWWHTDYFYTKTVGHGSGDSHGNHQERVNTLRYIAGFVYNAWIDLSPPMPDFSKYPVVMATFGAKTEFGGHFTALEFKSQKEAFYAATKGQKKGKQDCSEGVTFVNSVVGDLLTEPVLIELDRSQRPAHLTTCAFVMASILGCSCCFRHWMWSKIGKLDYDFHKQVFAVAGDSQQIAATDFKELVVNPMPYRPQQPSPIITHNSEREDVYGMGAKQRTA